MNFLLKRFGPVLAAVLLLPAVAAAADVKLVRVVPGWRDAGSFKRISEYFSGKENTGGQVVLRTQPDARGGYYFIARVDNPGAATDAKLVVTVVTPESASARVFTFATSLPAKETVYNLGITGSDWPNAKIHPVAWKLEVFDSTGRLLDATKSYLWEKPVKE